MIEVLVFVYENYWYGEPCPEPLHLKNRLKSVGFDHEEIGEALHWLDDLKLATTGLRPALPGTAEHPAAPACSGGASIAPSTRSMRIYTGAEQNRLGSHGMGFIAFLECAGAMSAQMREIVLDRAMATGRRAVPLEDLKLIVLLVYWSLGREPDALILDELCDSRSIRPAH